MLKKRKQPTKKNKSAKRKEKIPGQKESFSSAETEGTKTRGRTPPLLRGFRDIMPKDEDFWRTMYHAAEGIAESYNYQRIETPILEEATLFVRSLGRGTDVVDKEMYIFEDRDGTRVALRPEATASVARAFVIHGMNSLPQPIKVWYWGPMFRHDRPQAGRFREFHQFGCENLGVHDPVVDAELIVVAYNFLADLDIKTQVRVNSIGNREDRERYLVELTGYLRSKRSYLCEDCRRRINKNPLRCLDCKHEDCRPVIEEAPQILDWLGDESKKFFMAVLEYLDETGVPYVLEPTLVRGLDYYTDTVFEIYQEEKEGEETAQSALAGGGRYDGLVAELGGQSTPGSGFSVGLERVVAVLRRQAEAAGAIGTKPTKFYLAHLGEQSRKRALKLVEELRRGGIKIGHNLAKLALKGQLESADKQGASHTLILGQKELQDGTIIIRDMESGIQEIVDQRKLKQEIKKIVER